MSFDWQTDEDERQSTLDWDAPLENEKTTAVRGSPPWRLIGAIGLLAILTGSLIWWQISQRVEAATQAVRSDVIASHNLVQKAATDGDEEIFRSFLSGRDPAWTTAELELFRNQMLSDRASFGLTPAAGALPAILSLPGEEVSSVEVTANVALSSDLNEAVVTVPIPYEVDGRSEPVVLEQTSVYRRGDQRWLLSPPSPDYWGESQTTNGQYLSLIYPGRDEAIATRLAGDLDELIGRMCTTLVDMGCSADLFLTVRLSIDPGVLAAQIEPLGAQRRSRERNDILELPAPTILGLPAGSDAAQQEDAYRAVLQGYAQQVLGATMSRVTGWECCNDALLFLILQEYQLSRLGLANWPVGPQEYQRVLEERLRLSDITASWRNIPADTSSFGERTWQLYTAVDFLLNVVPDLSTADMQRVLSRTTNTDRFVEDIFASQAEFGQSAWIPGSLDQAWWLYAYSGALMPQESLIQPADDGLHLVCTSVEGNQGNPSTLWHYLPDQDRWQELYRVEGFMWMSALPRKDVLLLQEYSLLMDTWQTHIWSDGQKTPVKRLPYEFSVSFAETNPAGDKMVVYVFEDEGERMSAVLASLDPCDGECEITSLPGLPSWSPDGQQAVYGGSGSWLTDSTTIISANGRYVMVSSSGRFTELPLALGSGDAANRGDLVQLGNGYSPFWIDDVTFGYIREIGPIPSGVRSEQEIVLANVNDIEPQPLLLGSDLLQFLPDGHVPRWLTLAYVASHPAQPESMFIVALDELARRAYVFMYEPATGRIELRLDMLYNLNHSLGFSPDGRYLVMTGQESQTTIANDNTGILLLHEIDTNRTVPFITRIPFFLPSVGYDWTEDSRRLVMALGDNLIGIVDPVSGQFQPIPHGNGACTSLAWLEQ
ncbi:MAG: hypothetical protein R6X18_06260 [Chloroflexota bacterium]|jgi:hypothetical protein